MVPPGIPHDPIALADCNGGWGPAPPTEEDVGSANVLGLVLYVGASGFPFASCQSPVTLPPVAAEDPITVSELASTPAPRALPATPSSQTPACVLLHDEARI